MWCFSNVHRNHKVYWGQGEKEGWGVGVEEWGQGLGGMEGGGGGGGYMLVEQA